MSRYDFLCETYRTERLKTLGVWAQVPDDRIDWRAEPRARTPHEHMVHQCVSEDGWMRKMLGIDVSRSILPADENRLSFMEHYATVSAERLAALEEKPDSWYEEEVDFFDVRRSRAWVSADFRPEEVWDSARASCQSSTSSAIDCCGSRCFLR